MNIKQALKEKNKLAKKITDLMERTNKYNSVEEGAVRSYDPKASLDESLKMVEDLVTLKTNIHKTNAEVYEKIFRMSEYKSFVKYLRGLNCSEGNVSTYRYGEGNTRKMTTVITEVQRDNMIESFEVLIDSLQSELDSHNATTHI
jgi:DNA-directed RNA polymerase sigma subunit (sigma70/sigma32)